MDRIIRRDMMTLNRLIQVGPLSYVCEAEDSCAINGVGANFAAARAALRSVDSSLNEAAQQVMLGQANAESGFGEVGQFKLPDGRSSHNWGAIYAKGTCGTIPVTDTEDGKPFTANAAWNCTAEDGARQFYNLIRYNYSPALEKASAGDAWGYALALWRDGPGSKRPSYYGGFPPGHKWSLAPAGTPLHSDLDHYYRILAYAKMVKGAADNAAGALGQSKRVFLKPPAPNEYGKGAAEEGKSITGALVFVGLGAAVLWLAMGGYKYPAAWVAAILPP